MARISVLVSFIDWYIGLVVANVYAELRPFTPFVVMIFVMIWVGGVTSWMAACWKKETKIANIFLALGLSVFGFFVFFLFVGLKVSEFIDWNWFYVFIPAFSLILVDIVGSTIEMVDMFKNNPDSKKVDSFDLVHWSLYLVMEGWFILYSLYLEGFVSAPLTAIHGPSFAVELFPKTGPDSCVGEVEGRRHHH